MTSPVYRRALVGFSALALGLGGALVGVAPANAAHLIYVTSMSGSAGVSGSLPAAVIEANGDPGSTIVFDPVISGTIVITDLMVITESVTITGPGSTVLEIDAPGIAFEMTPTTPVIDVLVTGLSLTDSAATPSACGIDAFQTNLTLLDVVSHGFDCDGISVADGSLTATDVWVHDNAGSGITFAGFDAQDTLTLSGIQADDNGNAGVYAALLDSTATISSVNTTNSSFGFIYGSTNSTAAITGVHTQGAQFYGVTISVDASSTVNLSDSSAGALPPATNSPGGGFFLEASDGSTINAARVAATDNELGGVAIEADESTVNLSASLVQNNGVSSCGCAGGGGISINALSAASDGIITISGTHVLENDSDFGAGIYVGRHDNDAQLTITDSVISRNIADADGGGVYAVDVGSGFASGPISIVRTTISDNEASGYGGGVSIDGFSDALTEPQFLFESTTVSGNSAGIGGGGIQAYKDDPSGRPGIVKLLNTTVSGNDSPTGAGLLMEPVSGLGAGEFTLIVAHSTVANNTGGGEGLLVTDTDLDLEITHSIFSGNGATDVDWTGITSAAVDYSLIQNPSGTAVIPAAPGNIVGVDPDLGPLKDNGGPTFTHLIAPGSAAYNAGNPAITGAPTYDQRGLARIYQTIDIGAVEWHPALAATGSEPEPEPGLVGLLLLFTGLALVAASRRFAV